MGWDRLLATIIRSSRKATRRADDALGQRSVRFRDLPELEQCLTSPPLLTQGPHTTSSGT